MFVISISPPIPKIFATEKMGHGKRNESFGIWFDNKIILNFFDYIRTHLISINQNIRTKKFAKIFKNFRRNIWPSDHLCHNATSRCQKCDVTSDTSMYTYCVNIRFFVWFRAVRRGCVFGWSFEKVSKVWKLSVRGKLAVIDGQL